MHSLKTHQQCIDNYKDSQCHQLSVLFARRTIKFSQHTRTHVLGLTHLVGYTEYNRTIVLLVVLQSYDL